MKAHLPTRSFGNTGLEITRLGIGDLLDRGIVATLRGEIGSIEFDGQPELVTALDVGNRLDRRIGQLCLWRHGGLQEGASALARIDDALLAQAAECIPDDGTRQLYETSRSASAVAPPNPPDLTIQRMLG